MSIEIGISDRRENVNPVSAKISANSLSLLMNQASRRAI
jgi:hypothetical protein